MYITETKTYVDKFLASYKNKGTSSPYRLALIRFNEYLSSIKVLSINSVTLEVGEGFITYLATKGYSDKTISMTLATVKCFIGYLATMTKHEGKVINTQILLVRPPKLSSREQKTECLTEAEVKRLLSVCYNLSDTFQALQAQFTVIVLVNAGLRLQELTQLKLSNFKLENNHYVISIIGKNMRHRTITLSRSVTDQVKIIFEALKLTNDQYIVTGEDNAGNSSSDKPMNHSSMFKRIVKWCKMANIKRDISPHSLRRTCGTIMYLKGVPLGSIQRILGHDNAETTQRYIAMEADKAVSLKYALELTHDESEEAV